MTDHSLPSATDRVLRFTPVPVTSTRWPLRTASSDVIDGEYAVAIVAMHKWAPTLG